MRIEDWEDEKKHENPHPHRTPKTNRPVYDRYYEIGDDNHLSAQSLCHEFGMEGIKVDWEHHRHDEAFQIICDFLFEHKLLTKFRHFLERHNTRAHV
jgi:hypothetical protein